MWTASTVKQKHIFEIHKRHLAVDVLTFDGAPFFWSDSVKSSWFFFTFFNLEFMAILRQYNSSFLTYNKICLYWTN